MTSRNLLARLAGAQPEVLSRARTDRIKYTAMGTVLLTTAGVAGVSAMFALNSAVGLPIWVASIAGLLWALAILNLDRMLIVSITRQSTTLANLVSAAPRILLAVVIGTIVSVPLVLRIFQPEIDNELQVMHSENLVSSQQKLDAQFADIETLRTKVDQLQAIASGESQPSVSDDPDVKAANARVNSAQAAYDKAYAAAQCELTGACGTKKTGIGEAYNRAKAKSDQAKSTLDQAKRDLETATTRAQQRLSTGAASNRKAAADELATKRPILEKREAERAEAQTRLDNGEENSEGLLARLEALDRLTSNHGLMQLAHWSLILLFLLIEVLPVMVKLMLTLGGKPTLYDRLLAETEEAIEHDEAARKLREDLTAQQIREGKKVNKLLVAKQSEIAKKAIETWNQVAMSRSDEELERWYAAHTARPPEPLPTPAATPASVPSTVTVPLSKPVPAPAPAPVGDPDPPTAPFQAIPAPVQQQSYQQYKALVGAPRNNGSH